MTAGRRIRPAPRSPCQSCGGIGLFAPAVPSCDIPGKRAAWIVVERCDTCERYANDVAAALARFGIAGWFRCNDGGWHALARRDSRLA